MIGIVSVEFFVAKNKLKELEEVQAEMKGAEVRSQKENPTFFNRTRCKLLRELYIRLDADGELKLDMLEMAPFFHYVFDKFFGVDLNRTQTTALFQLMDVDGDAYCSYEEFICFVTTLKQMEAQSRDDPNFAIAAFPPHEV